jgi:hypothetical protein
MPAMMPPITSVLMAREGRKNPRPAAQPSGWASLKPLRRTRMALGELREERRRFGPVDGVARCAKPITTWSRGENLAVPTASPCGRCRSQPLVCSEEVSALLPRIILHNVVSLDGRMDWFTPGVGLFYELASRWQEDAIARRKRHHSRGG